MGNILKWFSDVANSFFGSLNLSEEAMIAIFVGIIIIGISLAFLSYRFIRRTAGKTIGLIALIVILITTGFFSTAEFASFAEKIGFIEKSSVGEGMEVNGDAFLQWVKGKQPGKEDGAGTWVPNKNDQGSDDFLN